MPAVSEAARELILAIFDAANSYFDSFSAWLETINPDATKSLRRKSAARQQRLEQAKDQLVDACTALVLEAVREAFRNEKGVVSWMDWLQESDLYELFEIGFKPAFERFEAAIDAD